MSPQVVQVEERRITARQRSGRSLEIRVANRHFEEKPCVEESLDNRPRDAQPVFVVIGAEDAAGSLAQRWPGTRHSTGGPPEGFEAARLPNGFVLQRID